MTEFLLFYFDVPTMPQVNAYGWSDILIGAICAFAGALLFVWIGRRFFKRR